MKKPAMIASLMLAASCATPVNFKLADANIVEAVLTFEFDHLLYQVPIPNDITAQVQAQEQCRRWGYSKAEKLPYSETICKLDRLEFCLQWRVRHRYKCHTKQR